MSTARRPPGRPRQRAEASQAGPRPRAWLFGALGLLYLLHNDLWLWRDGRLLLGLPVGLTYHVLYCVAAAVLMALLVRWAWPSELAAETPE